MLMSRRGIIGGLASMLAAPAIVHAGNLMPINSRLVPSMIAVRPWGRMVITYVLDDDGPIQCVRQVIGPAGDGVKVPRGAIILDIKGIAY
jgi:hypothetical protein